MRTTFASQRSVIPSSVGCGRVFFSGRIGPCVFRNEIKEEHKVPPACAHADESACSLTAVGMTIVRKPGNLSVFTQSL